MPTKKHPKYYCPALAEYTSVRGEKTRLAEAVGVKISIMSLWCSGKRRIPTEQCLKIYRATNGFVLPSELRKDIKWSLDV